MGRKVDLPSGAILEIELPPFSAARALYQAFADEAKLLKIDLNADIDVNFLKDIVCASVSSKKIEVAMAECLKRVTYNGLRIDDSTFEPLEARQDYLMCLYEVAHDSIRPFLASLMQRLSPLIDKLKGPQESKL